MLFTPIYDMKKNPTVFAKSRPEIFVSSVMFIQNKYYEYLWLSVILSVSCVHGIDVPYHEYFIQQCC